MSPLKQKALMKRNRVRTQMIPIANMLFINSSKTMLIDGNCSINPDFTRPTINILQTF